MYVFCFMFKYFILNHSKLSDYTIEFYLLYFFLSLRSFTSLSWDLSYTNKTTQNIKSVYKKKFFKV